LLAYILNKNGNVTQVMFQKDSIFLHSNFVDVGANLKRVDGVGVLLLPGERCVHVNSYTQYTKRDMSQYFSILCIEDLAKVRITGFKPSNLSI
jgi:hypothetical protein